MAIPDEHKWRYVFHFTDIENLDSIIKHGLLCPNVKNENGIEHKKIANDHSGTPFTHGSDSGAWWERSRLCAILFLVGKPYAAIEVAPKEC